MERLQTLKGGKVKDSHGREDMERHCLACRGPWLLLLSLGYAAEPWLLLLCSTPALVALKRSPQGYLYIQSKQVSCGIGLNWSEHTKAVSQGVRTSQGSSFELIQNQELPAQVGEKNQEEFFHTLLRSLSDSSTPHGSWCSQGEPYCRAGNALPWHQCCSITLL